MKFSIRIRLALLIGLVFLFVLVFLLSAGALTLYLRLNEELDHDLKLEKKFVIEMLERDFSDLLILNKEASGDLETNFIEDLDEIVGFKREFVIVYFGSKKSKPVFTNSRPQNILQQFPEGILTQKEGIYNQLLDNRRYRILISKQEWGTLLVGLENRIFFKVIDELGKILVVGIPLTLLLVLIGGWFLARLVMRPVVSAARTAENITLTKLEKRLPEYTGKDEFGVLVTTLNHMIARLEEGVKQIRQFTQDAAHELRTPLTIQRGELELLFEQGKLSKKARAAVQKSLDRAISMSKIVDNLMLLAKSDTGMYPIQMRKFRLDEILQETVEDAKNLSQSKNIEICLEKCPRLEYLGDEQLIRRLLLNLSDNALKNTFKGQIKFYLKIHSDSVEIRISDTGTGIPQEDLPHVFDRFYRGDKSRNTTKSGTGLGLSISRWIINAHNGSINIESKSGKGTTVKITLPLSNSTH